MGIATNDTVITLSHQGSSAEIYFFGAHVSSWRSPSEAGGPVEERFFMSKTAVLDGTGPIRGGIPIAFPIFATDKHPDYPELGGAHGFARINKWTLASQTEDDDKTTVVLTLETNDRIAALFDKPFRLEYTVTLYKAKLDTQLKISNLGGDRFRFNTCLHTYYLLPEGSTLADATVAPLDGLRYTSRLDPNSPHDLVSPSAVSLTEETARCYHLPEKASTEVFVDYGGKRAGEGVRVLTEGDWTDSVLWNPAAKAGGAIGDLHEGGWRDFVCWEPGVIQNLRWLAPGETWEGRQLMTAV